MKKKNRETKKQSSAPAGAGDVVSISPAPSTPARQKKKSLPQEGNKEADRDAVALAFPANPEATAPTEQGEVDENDEPGAEAALALEEEEGARHRRFVLRKELGTRIDVYLQQRLKGISRSKVQQLIELGGVMINDKKPKASTQIHQGDVIDVILPAPAIREIVPEYIPLDVLYEDDAFIVLNKQANLIVHPARGQRSGTLINGLAWHFKEKLEATGGQWRGYETRGFKKERQKRHGDYQKESDALVPGLSSVGAADFRPGIVHRLDKNTTGVIVVAKSDAAHWQIARQFEDRTTLKAYLAVVHGNFDEPSGVIDEPIGKHPTIREAYAIRRDSQGKHAVTLFRVREQYQGYALVELELKTGRTHQIRVHLTYLGHPIVGDLVYGGEAIGKKELDEPVIPAGARKFITFAREREDGLALEAKAKKREDLILAHPALHATFLRFTHPLTQTPMTFTAPVHEPMRGLIKELRQRPSKAPTVKEGYWVDLQEAVPK